MIFNFAIWSPMISLMAIILLYPLRQYYRSSSTSRFYVALFLWPALSSSIYTLKLVLSDKLIVNKHIITAFSPLFFGIHITDITSYIITCSLFTIVMLTFLLSPINFTEIISLLATSFLAIFIMSVSQDIMLSLSVFSIGTILVTYLLLLNNPPEKTILKSITGNFILGRISDLVAFISLIALFVETKTLMPHELAMQHTTISELPKWAFFIAMILRIISFNELSSRSEIKSSHLKTGIFKQVFTIIGVQILLTKLAPILFDQRHLNTIFILISIAIIIIFFLPLFYNHHHFILPRHLLNIAASFAILLLCMKHDKIALYLACSATSIFLILDLTNTIKPIPTIFSRTLSENLNTSFLQDISKKILIATPSNTTYLLSRLFVNFLNQFYSGFLLYRLPKILLTILQIPLRIMSNGNIQRSLFFIVILLASYISWWS